MRQINKRFKRTGNGKLLKEKSCPAAQTLGR